MKFTKGIVLCSLVLTLCMGCAYEKAYMQYADSQAKMAQAAGPLITFHPSGQVASIGNPMVAMAMMNMKAPKHEVEMFTSMLSSAFPWAFGALMGNWAMQAVQGANQPMNVSGDGNYIGNASGNQSPNQLGSPVTTTTLSGEGSIGGASEITK